MVGGGIDHQFFPFIFMIRAIVDCIFKLRVYLSFFFRSDYNALYNLTHGF
jgi:hypothetical protein